MAKIEVTGALARRLPEIDTKEMVARELAPLPNFAQRPSITSFPFIRADSGMEINASSLHGSKIVSLTDRHMQNRADPIRTTIVNQVSYERENAGIRNVSPHKKKKKIPSLSNRPIGKMLAHVTHRIFFRQIGATTSAKKMKITLWQKERYPKNVQ